MDDGHHFALALGGGHRRFHVVVEEGSVVKAVRVSWLAAKFIWSRALSNALVQGITRRTKLPWNGESEESQDVSSERYNKRSAALLAETGSRWRKFTKFSNFY